MTSISPLLNLPKELRDEIWSLAFSNQDVSGPGKDSFHSFLIDCEPCFGFSAKERNDPSTAIIPYFTAFRPLLTCKQIYAEASKLFHDTMAVHILTLNQFVKAQESRKSPRDKLTRCTLYVHLDDDTRYDWLANLTNLAITFPKLTHLTVHNHMRPPTTYDRLVDAVFLAGPLTTLPRHITQTLHFAYLKEEVMFESPFLGDIRCSDAIEEHELVIRDVLADEEFRVVSSMGDVNAMTVRLLGVARSHEQTWLEGLQRRRMGEHGFGHGGGGEDDDEGEEDQGEESSTAADQALQHQYDDDAGALDDFL